VTTTMRPSQPVGDLLREWRRRRKLTQMDLSLESGISTRHLSFIETGRTAPSRHLVLRLGETLGLPLRERNQLLLAAGYAPVYQETSLGAPAMSAVRDMVRQVLAAHEPFPGFVVDGHWHRVEANQPALLFTVGVSPELLEEPVNVLRLCLHPEGLAPQVVNLGEWRAHLLARLRQQIAATADPELTRLYDELKDYPCDQEEPDVELPGPGEIAIPLRLMFQGEELAFYSTVSTFGTPLDITVAELAIESFFPADARTAKILHTTTW
jgi:transcriptional regulator with XRE-family HTH domain